MMLNTLFLIDILRHIDTLYIAVYYYNYHAIYEATKNLSLENAHGRQASLGKAQWVQEVKYALYGEILC